MSISGKNAGRRSRARVTAPAAATPTAAVEVAPEGNHHELFIDRELSLLRFQRRVLEEAIDQRNPLLDRLKFLAIVGSNLNEFFMVRVAGLMDQVDAGVTASPDGLHSPLNLLHEIRAESYAIMQESRDVLILDLLPALAARGVHVLSYEALDRGQRLAADKYFREIIFPILTPLAFDPGRPFPHISNLSLNLAVLIQDKKKVRRFARLKIPDTLSQFVPVGPAEGAEPVNGSGRGRGSGTKPPSSVVWIEEVVAANLPALFPGMKILSVYSFHVTRDADMEIQELEASDLLETVEQSVRQRRFGNVVRLQVNEEMPAEVLTILLNNLEVEPEDVYRLKSPLGLSRMMDLYGLDRPDLKEPVFVPRVPAPLQLKGEEEDIFSAIRRGDVLLHNPFDSFQPLIEFLRRAAADPQVQAIKMTLYRVGRNSPVVEALLEAIEEGKQVAVLVELKARFDEESNIEWARALERQGVHVVYGLLGLKIHTKLAMVVRREGKTMRRYMHLGTGNYNAVTAHLYTDLGMFTCDKEIGEDVTDLFNYLTGYSEKKDYRKLLVAPIDLRQRIVQMIEREIAHSQAGRPARLIFKVNGLVDRQMIRLLYDASREGVRVDLLVRGVCCLRPGIPGVSENIRVTSIVGRFLEHSRVFFFENGGAHEVYMGSADLMPRNLNERVETAFPVSDRELVRVVREDILELYLRDNVKARRMHPDGSYSRVTPVPGEEIVNAQEVLLERTRKGANR
ncbi:MAG: polyphosphate kinase 1 [Bryobacterales bacterium]|nr:polyphosphate kinase 1 [Bryobacterales bacterium]